jgi:hypothetical protein
MADLDYRIFAVTCLNYNAAVSGRYSSKFQQDVCRPPEAACGEGEKMAIIVDLDLQY